MAERVTEAGRRPARSLPVLQTPAQPAGAAERVDGTGVRIALVTLGCDKNTVDSERILGRLAGAGARLVEPEDADVVVINTCGFIEVAKQESIETILQAARLKEEGRVRAVVAMGCLVQRYKDELSAELPEVDLFLGLMEQDRLLPELEERGLLPEADVPLMERPLRVITSAAPHTSHLKISEGCDHGCAFCAIPLMRGKFRSTPLELLVREAVELERSGVVELGIVSQDTSWYGRDWVRAAARGDRPTGDEGSWFVGKPFEGMAGLGLLQSASRRLGEIAARTAGPVRDGAFSLDRIPRTGALPHLLQALLSETDIPWLRLFYMYPSGITRELVELMAREPRLLPYLDMPIQHGSDRVLERMRRPERRRTIRERVAWLRDAIPDLALRTTVIVGFPGERDEDFEALLELLDEVRFDHVGAFAYSEEEGTAAATMAEQVPPPVRRERLERLVDAQRTISLERNEARIGAEVTVLIDEAGPDGEAVGRTPWQAYEIDGIVVVRGAEDAQPGSFVRARLTGASEYDWTATIIPEG